MKIVNRKEFLTLPVGTVFAEYAPCFVGDLRIKGETLSNNNDWFYQQIDLAIDCHDSNEMIDLLDESARTGKSMRMRFDVESRDGAFDDKQLYAIYEREDVIKLIIRLEDTLV